MSLDEFHRLLRERVEAPPDRRAELDEKLWDRFGRQRAVMVSDMARFSRITRDHGILHFLSMIHRMTTTCTPVVEAHGGTLIKVVADNLFAVFDTAQSALDAGVAMAAAVREEGNGRPDEEQVWLAIGIAAGRILDIGGTEVFGDAVNLASKLGEDTAVGGDILITTDAAGNVTPPDGYKFESRRTQVSAMELDYLALVER